ncbi:DUF4913 domain-containing protein, partial [Nocardia alni]|uniref:DUF4913 domain-containing protein n=1 Tax=Nocardia alni TaxID=2815723 RepID=UPI001C249A1B
MTEDDDSIFDADSEFRPGAIDSVVQPPEAVFADVVDFVENRLVYVYRRVPDTANRRWCPQWWKHDEAVLRLYALWRAYEALRRDDTGTGLSTWWLHHADPHMSRLMAVDGPFELCRRGHRDGDQDGNPDHGITPLPHIPADPD